MKIVEVFVQDGQVVGSEWLQSAETIHRQLRPKMPGDYATKMERVMKEARMALAVEGDKVLGLAVYRWHENTFDGLKFYVDDLVTDEA